MKNYEIEDIVSTIESSSTSGSVSSLQEKTHYKTKVELEMPLPPLYTLTAPSAAAGRNNRKKQCLLFNVVAFLSILSLVVILAPSSFFGKSHSKIEKSVPLEPAD